MGATTIERRLTAFGETKTVAEWEMDRRAAVYGELMLSRLAEGMSPEQAISTPTVAVERGPARYMAYGERKTLRDWADDVRCVTSHANLRRRIEDGWPVEEAIATPTKVQKLRTATAWGETKSLSAWAADERAGASRDTIAARLDEGWAPEEAIATPGAEPHGGLTVWGETKTLADWARDERCAVTAEGLAVRLRKGMGPEEAVSTPSQTKVLAATAWGETKTLREWSEDPRCEVAYVSLYERIRRGMGAEAAISTPPERPTREVTAWGETKSLLAWSRDERAAVGYNAIRERVEEGWAAERAISEPPSWTPRTIVAWGETRSAEGWARDERALASASTILTRLEKGWDAEEAISTSMRETQRTIEAFGETKTAAEWAEDPRCAVDRRTLLNRLGNDWEAERALVSPLMETRDAITAWGETKAAYAWTRDPRCVVAHGTLTDRIDEGWAPEEALTTAPKACDHSPIEAWGETRSLAEWRRDPRATNRNVRERMARGMSAEEAIGGPVKAQNREGLTAFGEWRSFNGWAADARCSVDAATIIGRVARGMAPEEAVTTPGRLAGRREEDAIRLPGMAAHARPIVAWGETRAQSAWARDARCPESVTSTRIRERLDEGWSPESAISTPYEAGEPRTLSAFGETKTYRAWGEDARAAVDGDRIRNRVKLGWEPERSIVTPNDKARHEITAFGETKLATTWGRDPRARAAHSTILRRVEEGWEPEAAITTPAVVNRPVDLAAWGETRSLAAWARDARAAVSAGCIGDRVERGWTPEEAITTPGDNGPKTVTAFGETKSSIEWAEDARCAVSRTTLLGRLNNGWEAERAIMEIAKVQPPTGVTAWGETKSMAQWAEDSRCLVLEPCLCARLAKGEPPERAMGRPSRSEGIVAERRGQAVPEGMEGKPAHTLFIEAFGETKCLADWVRDPRCLVAGTTLKARLRAGMAPEAALTVAPERGIPLTLEAFGEVKSGAEWARDARCRVSVGVLYNRLNAGTPTEEALTTPSPEPHSQATHEAFGETKTLKAWSEDPRCAVTYSGLKSRVLKAGMPMEEALTTGAFSSPRAGSARGTTAYGETKGVAQWAKDARCRVPRAVLEARLTAGWRAEDALTVSMGVAFDPLARAA